MNQNNFDVIVIGAGVIGANIARVLSEYELNTLIIEKENDVGNVTSMANSAVIHAGYDPLPNTLKAKFNVEGNKLFPKLCKRLDVKFNQIGSLTVALTNEDLTILNDLAKRAKENGVEVKIINHDELLKIEPNINKNAAGALFAPTAGIIDPFTFVAHNIENALDNKVLLHLNEEVKEIKDKKNELEVITTLNTYKAKVVINAAGLGAYNLVNSLEKLDYQINPRKGEYFILDKNVTNLVNHILFPLPSAKGKGVLVSLTYGGNCLVGPSSEPSNLDDRSTDSLTLNSIKMQATNLIPNIPFNETIRVFAGVRSTPSDHDFHISPLKNHPNFIHICGIESPGFVSSPAIAEYVVNELVKSLISLKKKKDYIPNVKKSYITQEMELDDLNKLIKEHPEYGEIICQCEKISKGEILDALSRSDKPKTIKAIKKRCRAGFGRCQGGFCQPLVAKIISEYYHIPLNKVLYDSLNSEVAPYETIKGVNHD